MFRATATPINDIKRSGALREQDKIALLGFGDSRISYDSTVSSTTYITNNYGWTNQANFFLDGLLDTRDEFDLGVSGNSTTDMAARLADIATAREKYPYIRGVVFQGGTNDANSVVSLATTTANYKTIFDYILNLGLKLYILEEFPRNTWTAGSESAKDQLLKDYNAYYTTYAALYPEQVRIIKLYSAFLDPAGTGVSAYANYVDSTGVHQEVSGAIVGGRLLANAIRNDFGQGFGLKAPNQVNCLTNGFLTGTGGTNSTANVTVTGATNIPQNWTLASSLSAGANTLTISREADGALRFNMAVVAGGSTSSLIRMTQTITLANGAYNQGDYLRMMADFRVVSATRVRGISLQVTDDTSGTDYVYQGLWRQNGFAHSTVERGVGKTHDFKVQSNNTQLVLRWEIYIDATSAGSAIVDLYGLGIMRDERVYDTFPALHVAVGNVGTGEDNLMVYNLPPSTLYREGRYVEIEAWGVTANNANAKTLKMYFGSQVILTTSLTTSIAGNWYAKGIVICTGVDTQDWTSFLIQGATTIVDPENGTATQNDAAVVVIKCTGEATADNDIIQHGMIVKVGGR